MTNEQAKQEAIKNAWEKAGFNWTQIKDKITFDGCIELTHPSLKTSLDGYLAAHALGLLKGVSFNGASLTVQLSTLNGINFNNGWIRIESDGSNLPEIDYHGPRYKTIKMNGDLCDETISGHLVNHRFKNELITHYKPIKEEPKPVY